MYGHKGGSKEGRKYPTVENVMQKFYEMYPDATLDSDPDAGEIPRVRRGVFRFEKCSRRLFTYKQYENNDIFC